MRTKFKELDKWVESYNQPPDPKSYPIKHTKGSDLREKLKTKKLVIPKYVYVVLIVRGESMQIVGCFYNHDEALKYADGATVQKLEVL